jgi:hypothetical protein
MSDRTPLPDALRRAVEADHGAVRPLRPAGQRVAAIVLWAMLLLALLPILLGLRGDAEQLGFALSWGAAVFECAVALLLVVLALREAVPGVGSSPTLRALAVAGGFGAQLLVAVLCWAETGFPHGTFPPANASCFPVEGVLGVPALAVTAFLVARAYAVRPRWAGLLGGTGAGLLADGAWHLICPHTDLPHLLIYHLGAVLLLAVMGYLAGCSLEVLQRRRLVGRF